MRQFSLRDLFILTGLIAVEVALAREIASLRGDDRAGILILFWLTYGIAMGMIAASILSRKEMTAAIAGAIIGGVGQLVLWTILWLSK